MAKKTISDVDSLDTTGLGVAVVGTAVALSPYVELTESKRSCPVHTAVNLLLAAREKIKVQKKAVAAAESVILPAVIERFFNANRNTGASPGGVSINNPENDERDALAIFADKYPVIKDTTKVKATVVEERIIATIGQENFDKFFEPVADVTVDITAIPRKNRQTFIAGLRTLVDSLGIPEEAVQVLRGRTAKEGFHVDRHIALTENQNIRLHEIYPCTVSVK